MRQDDWLTRLLAVLDEQERQPHVYGQSDCLLKVAHSSLAMLKDGPRANEIEAAVARYAGQYDTLAGAYRILARDGLTPLGLVQTLFEEVHPAMAHSGDIGAMQVDGHWAFGHIVREHFYPSIDLGTGLLPRRVVEKAFSVG